MSSTTCALRRCIGSALFLHPTAPLLKDVKRSDFGESRRLSFDERAERRVPKTKEQKLAKEQLMLEAEQYVNSEFPDELEALFEKARAKSMILSLRILNIAKCIESLDVDAPGTSGPHAKKLLLLQLAQVVKTKPNELELTPLMSSNASAVLNRVSRFDASLQVSKENAKIRVVIPPTTTARRDKAASDIRGLVVELKNKAKLARQNATKVLGSIGIDESTLREHAQTLDTKVHEFLEEKALELEMVAEEVMTMGVDEADDAATPTSQSGAV